MKPFAYLAAIAATLYALGGAIEHRAPDLEAFRACQKASIGVQAPPRIDCDDRQHPGRNGPWQTLKHTALEAAKEYL